MTVRLSQFRCARAALIVVALLASPVAPAGTPSPSPAITQQIDALLKHRLRPEPLPVELPNPFVVTAGGIRDAVTDPVRGRSNAFAEAGAAAANPDREAVAPTNVDVLAACASRLRIGGVIRIKDQLQIVVNDTPRKEGDFITVPWSGASVHLRIVKLLPEQLTLRYLDAELTVRY